MPTRRQFLFSAASLGAATTTSWYLHHQLNRLPSVTVNRLGLPLGHALRDKTIPLHPSQTYDCNTLIVGGGAAALNAAWWLHKHGQRDFLLLDGMERNGNAAAYTFSGSLNAPTGAHYLPQPSSESVFVRELLLDLGLLHINERGGVVYSESDLVHAPDERLFRKGIWQDGLMVDDVEGQRFLQLIQRIQHQRGSDGKKMFAMPIVESSYDKTWRQLDTQTFAQWLAAQGYTSPDLLAYLDYCCRDDYGQGIAQVSAFAGLHYFAARGNENAAVLTWSDGLNHLVEKMRQYIGLRERKGLPESGALRFRQPENWSATALQIEEQHDNVVVWVRDNHSGEVAQIRAKQVICATPLFVTQRIVKNFHQYVPDGFKLPESAPWLVGNFVLHRFPKEAPNTELAWDNVVQGSRHLGYVVATHQHIHVAKPEHTIFTAYTALNHDVPQNIRRWLLDATDEALLHYVAEDLLTVYGSSFWRHVVHVDISVRAHAMAVPKVGYLSDDTLAALRRHTSRLLFAHSDLSGYSVFEEAAYWGVQAAKKVLAA